MSKPTTWGVSIDEEHFHGHYATKEEAIASATTELELEPGQRFWVGGGSLYFPEAPHPQDILERMAEEAGDECGEPAENWEPWLVKAEQLDELESALHAVLIGWMTRHRQMPDFYNCDVIEEHSAPAAAPRWVKTMENRVDAAAPKEEAK